MCNVGHVGRYLVEKVWADAGLVGVTFTAWVRLFQVLLVTNRVASVYHFYSN